jgi:hypothetical protein
MRVNPGWVVGLPEIGYGGMYGDFPLPGHVNKGMTTGRLLTPKGRQGVRRVVCNLRRGRSSR